MLAAVFFHGQPVSAEVRAGVAKETFVLPANVPLAGYSRRDGKPSAGAHDPVGVRALVLQQGDAMAALVSCDLLIVDEHLFDSVRRRLLRAGLPASLTLVLAGTHTHSGPGAYGTKWLEKISMGHFDPAVYDALVEAMIRAILRASGELSPARIAYGTATTDGLIQNRINPDGLIDPELIVVSLYRPSEPKPFAIVLSFSAHPTTLGAWNMQRSADYPGVVMRRLEEAVPGATALFFAGAVGDQAPVKSGEAFERAEWIGRALAERALEVLATAHLETPERVQAAQERMALPPAVVRIGRVALPRWIGARLVDDDATLALVQAGRTVWFGVPCDLTAGLGQALKAAARERGLEPMVVGFANDYIGYCVPASLYQAKQYESSMAFNGPKTGEMVVDRLKQMLDELNGSDKQQATSNKQQ